MRILAIETATEACSVALFEDGVLTGARYAELGRGHAERLVPMISELPGGGRAGELRVSLGPGSFTGVRIGIAAARALGLAWCAKVLGYPTLALVAAMARGKQSQPVGVCMNGGHGEWFVQDFCADGLPSGAWASLTPSSAIAHLASHTVAGNRAEEFAEAAGRAIDAIPLLPDARHVMQVPEALMTTHLSPIYGRAPDAKAPAK